MTGEFGNPYYSRWIPKYRSASDVDEIEGGALSEKNFYEDYVWANRPCVIRGAARDWPALRAWPDPNYLNRVAGHHRVLVHQAANMEGDMTITSPTKEAEKKRLGIRSVRRRGSSGHFDGYPYAVAPKVETSLAEFVEKAARWPSEALPDIYFLYSVPLIRLPSLAPDLGTFSFAPALRNSKRNSYYPHMFALFMYRSHITDWHYHVTTEALLTQVSGTKEVLLLAPDSATWRRIAPIQRETVYTYNADINRFPGYADLVPRRAVLHPGDSLFIPVYWWHLVATKSSTLGQSVTAWFDSAWHVQCDWRLPACRRTIRTAMMVLPRRKVVLVAPLAVVGLIAAALRRSWQRLCLRLRDRFSRRRTEVNVSADSRRG
jgi:hypothetical protein